MNYYIQGNPERAEEIKAAFDKLVSDYFEENKQTPRKED